jgi:uncharacterized membrane protein
MLSRHGGWRRAGTVQGVNTLLLIVLVGVLLYFIARTQLDEPITWLVRRVQSAVGM